MFDRRQLAAFRNTLQVAANDLTGPEAARLLHQTARAERERVVREQTGRAGVAPTDVVVADGVRGAPIEAAERLVVVEYGYLREVVAETLRSLVARSPKTTGRYARSFVVMVGGQEIESLEQIPHDAAEVVIVNTQPYARRLEVGKRADGRPFVVRVNPAIVEETAITAARRFGNVAELRFAYFDLTDPYVLRNDGTAGRRGRVRWKDRRAGRPVRYPGIRIAPR